MTAHAAGSGITGDVESQWPSVPSIYLPSCQYSWSFVYPTPSMSVSVTAVNSPQPVMSLRKMLRSTKSEIINSVVPANAPVLPSNVIALK